MAKYLRFTTEAEPEEALWAELAEDGTVCILNGNPLSGARRTGRILHLSDIHRWFAPVEPPDIIAIGANYADHCAESAVSAPSAPLVFLKATSSVTGHLEPILLPRDYPEEVDYEAELAVVIGRTARRVSREKALDHVFGYTCANDVSARDVQLKLDRQWARGKSFDSFCPLGPFLVTGADPSRARVRLRLDGRTMQDQSVVDMLFPIPIIIEYLSACMTLKPGTVILTGTPGGVGMGQKPPRYLREGDRAIVDIEGVGILENPVARG
jgi:2-keto-4-pentenoate hydratase/2-oxohepta-3-ene-1,7-dioic acid hydratase in catechol pathway